MISPRFKRLLASDHVTTSDGRVIPATALLYLDQGIAVISHASQGKTVDNMIVSAPVAAFAQVNEWRFFICYQFLGSRRNVIALGHVVAAFPIAGAMGQGKPSSGCFGLAVVVACYLRGACCVCRPWASVPLFVVCSEGVMKRVTRAEVSKNPRRRSGVDVLCERSERL